jgi:hypothetical protein
MLKQLLNHIDHFVWVCEIENLEKYVKVLSDLFMASFDGPYIHHGESKIYVSWDTGLEVISPISENAPAYKHLKEKGEGPYAMVFGVSNIEEAKERAQKLGFTPGEIINATQGSEPWSYRMERVHEVFVGKILGTYMLFGEIIYKDKVVDSI